MMKVGHRDVQSITLVMAVFKQSILQPVGVSVSTAKCGVTCTANPSQNHGLRVLTTCFQPPPQQQQRQLERVRPSSMFTKSEADIHPSNLVGVFFKQQVVVGTTQSAELGRVLMHISRTSDSLQLCDVFHTCPDSTPESTVVQNMLGCGRSLLSRPWPQCMERHQWTKLLAHMRASTGPQQGMYTTDFCKAAAGSLANHYQMSSSQQAQQSIPSEAPRATRNREDLAAVAKQHARRHSDSCLSTRKFSQS